MRIKQTNLYKLKKIILSQILKNKFDNYMI